MKLKKSYYVLSAVLILAIIISLFFSLSYIGKREIGIFIPFNKDKKPQLIGPGFAIHPPFFTKIIKYRVTGAQVEGKVSLTSKEGATLQFPYNFQYSIDRDKAEQLLHILASRRLNSFINEILFNNIKPFAAQHYFCSLLEENFSKEATAHLKVTFKVRGINVEKFTLHRIELDDRLKPIYKKSLVYRSMQNTGIKVFIIGVDGADWKIINTLIAQGKLPNFKKLKTQGAWGYLHSIRPTLSPLIWTTMITGKTPDIHGIIDFMVVDPETNKQVPITSTARKVKALWNIFFDFNYKSTIINWLASWPAETIKGNIITDRVHYSLRKYNKPSNEDVGKTFPPGLLKEIKSYIIEDEDISKEQLTKYIHASAQELQDSAQKELTENRISHFRTILASTLTYHDISLKLLEKGQPDFFAIYYPLVDSVGHLFIKEMPPRLQGISQDDFAKYKDVVVNAYQLQDKIIGDYLKRIEPNTIVMLVSDHGFISGPERAAIVFRKGDIWAEGFHRINGVIMFYGKYIKPGPLSTKSVYDIAPTILYLLGFPIPEDMQGKPITDGLTNDFTQQFRIRNIDTYETINPLKARKLPQISADDEKIKKNLQALGYMGSSSEDSFTSHSNLGSVYFNKQQFKLAEKEYMQALEQRSDNIPTMVRLILVYEKLGEVNRAIELHDKILHMAKSPNPEIYLLGIKIHLLKNDIAGAEKILGQVEAKSLHTKEILTAQGLIKQYHRDFSGAEQNFLEALRIDPLYYEAAERLTEIYLLSGNFDKAEAIIKHALSLQEDSFYHYNLLGTIYYQKGNFAKAERAFKQALHFSPDFLQPKINLGRCYFKTNKISQAINILNGALKSNPDNYEVLIILGACWLRQGDYKRAITNLKNALEVGPETVFLYNALGQAYSAKQDYQAAEEMLQKSLELDKNQPSVQKMLQRIKEARKQSP
jgi:predicted AlkP superfamily phosphohydrolase/phosphomutase/tetratricopeptide (TPR) repeat protein